MNAVITPPSIEDGQLLYLSPTEIDEAPGFNPRSYYDPAAQKALEASVRAEGIQQNLVVRPNPEAPGRYLVIAGHRRLRAAKAVALDEVPCLIRLVDDRQALAIAALENDKRENISPAEEARQAQRMLDACDGDREEACRVLGWSRSRLDARLLLLHAHDDVLVALAERRIKLGIAELLSGLPKPVQEKNLPVVIEKGYSVAELRQKLESLAQKLAVAIFDTTGCNGCPHNTSTQASLFDDGMSEGQCVGRTCFSEKTQAALKARKAELESEYNVVFLDVEKTAGSWAYLLENGENGVGSEQYAACKGCAHFGALLSSEPGCEGQVKESICFDPLCNAEKVKAVQATAKATQAGGRSSGKAEGQVKTRAKTQTAAAAPKKVRALSVGFLREQAAEVAQRDPATRRALLLHALLKSANRLSALNRQGLPDAYAELHAMDDDALEALERDVVAHFLRSYRPDIGDGAEIERTACRVLAVTGTELKGRFSLTREFLAAHTKSGIEALMREATDPSGQTFVDWWEAKRGPFKKLMAKKSDELIDAILGAGFDFSQWVPSCISAELDKVRVNAKPTATQEDD